MNTALEEEIERHWRLFDLLQNIEHNRVACIAYANRVRVRFGIQLMLPRGDKPAFFTDGNTTGRAWTHRKYKRNTPLPSSSIFDEWKALICQALRYRQELQSLAPAGLVPEMYFPMNLWKDY